jgi:hypothetical protein
MMDITKSWWEEMSAGLKRFLLRMYKVQIVTIKWKSRIELRIIMKMVIFILTHLTTEWIP